MADYKFYKDAVNQTTNVGVIWKSKKWIPFDDENIDYQEYLEWAKTNTAEAADEDAPTWDSIRAIRDQILKDTDWTMTTGASVDQAQVQPGLQAGSAERLPSTTNGSWLASDHHMCC